MSLHVALWRRVIRLMIHEPTVSLWRRVVRLMIHEPTCIPVAPSGEAHDT